MAVIHPSQIRRPAALQRGHRQQPLASMPAPEEQAKTERERIIKARVGPWKPESATLADKPLLGPWMHEPGGFGGRRLSGRLIAWARPFNWGVCGPLGDRLVLVHGVASSQGESMSAADNAIRAGGWYRLPEDKL